MTAHPQIEVVLYGNTQPEELGLLPYWVLNDAYFHLPLREAMEDQYQFPLYEIDGGEVDADGTFYYPDDPPLHPLIRIERLGEVFLQYHYGMVAFIDKDGQSFVTRMD